MNGESVREAREKLGLSQTEFGKRLGMSRRSIARYEKKDRVTPEPLRLAILRILDEHHREKHK